MDYPAQNKPKEMTRSDQNLQCLNRENETLNKSIHRLEDALTRIGHVFPPQAESTKANIAQVPNGHFGALSEKISYLNTLNSRLVDLLDTLDTFV